MVLNEEYSVAARFCRDFQTLEVFFHPFEDEPRYISNAVANITCFISRLLSFNQEASRFFTGSKVDTTAKGQIFQAILLL